MCPSKKTLSAFFDQELSSKKTQKIEQHLTHCAKCRQQIRTYCYLSIALDKSAYQPSVATQEAIWSQIQLGAVNSSSVKPFFALPLVAISFSIIIAVFLAVGSAFFLSRQISDHSFETTAYETSIANAVPAEEELAPSLEDLTGYRQAFSVSNPYYFPFQDYLPDEK